MAEDEPRKRRRGEPEPTLLEQTRAGAKGASLFHCNYCRKDISNVVRIKCAQCEDFDLCLECFSVGVEITPHKNDHPYRVMEKLDFPLITEDWTAAEELLLLEGIEMYGLGNWADVAMHVVSKSKGKCEQHYTYHYIDNAKKCIPDVSRAKSKTLFEAPPPKEPAASSENGKAASDSASNASKATSVGDAGGGKPTKQESRSMNSGARAKDNNAYANAPPGSEIVGFVPARGDFDVEYDNDAELLLCDLGIKPEDSPLDQELKLKMLEIYNWKLDERIRRKKFIIERGLLDFKKQQGLERRRSKEERELYQQMRVFSRFHSAEEHEELMRGLIMEKNIRRRIEQLQTYRQMGYHTLAEGDSYEADKKRKETHDKLKKDKHGASYLFSAPSRGNERAARARGRDKDDDLAIAPASNSGVAPGAAGSGSGSVAGGKTSRRSAEFVPHTVAGQPLDISGNPGVEALSPREKELCTSLRILPLQYLAAKLRTQSSTTRH